MRFALLACNYSLISMLYNSNNIFIEEIKGIWHRKTHKWVDLSM